MDNEGAPQRPGQQGESLSSPERATPEALRTQYRELYTVEGADFITEIKEAIDSAEIKRIKRVTESSVGFMEGLYFGIEGDNYDLDDDFVAGELMDMFTDVESSVDRPYFDQVFLALRHGLTEAVRDADRFNREKKKEGGVDEWRLQLGRERKKYWELMSQSRQEQGTSPLSEEEIARRVTEDINEKEARVSGWLDNKGDLIALKHHIDARVLTFDRCFTQRQRACEKDDNQVELTDKGIKPDKGSWMGYYWGNKTKEMWNEKEISEWGDRVSHVEDVIEGIARGTVPIPGIEDNPEKDFYAKDIYVNGFRYVGEFKAWLKVLLKESTIKDEEGNDKTRMDVVWNAWKMSLWKENISKLAWRVDKDGIYKFGNPPFTTDLMLKMIHNDKLRMKELGCKGVNEAGHIIDLDEWMVLDREGKILKYLTEDEYEEYMSNLKRSKRYRAISHGGHMMSVGRVKRLVDEYESGTKVDNVHKFYLNTKTRKYPRQVTLRDFTRNGISRGSKSFPWEDTQIKKPGDPVGEPASGSIGGWFLNRLRGDLVRKNHLRKIPDANQLTINFFEDSTVRMWDKLNILKPGKLTKKGVPQNPFAWNLAGILRARSQEDKKSDYTKGERSYRSSGQQNKTISWLVEGRATRENIADSDILMNALITGAISPEEKKWIEDNIVLEAGKRKKTIN